MRHPRAPLARPRVRPVQRSSSATLAGCLLTFLHPILFAIPATIVDQPLKTATQKSPYVPPERREGEAQSSPILPESQDINNSFINALTQASKCSNHLPTNRSRSLMGILKPHNPTYRQCRQKRSYFLSPGMQPAKQPRLHPSRQDCLNMVDYYAEEYSTMSTSLSLPEGVKAQSLDKPGLSNKLPMDEHTQAEVDRVQSVLKGQSCDHEQAWEAYQSLPYPGLALLSDYSKHRLLQKLTTIEKKNSTAMFRYMSVMDQLHSMGYNIKPALWNSAVAFAAHAYSRIEATSVESAILKWKEMENEYKIESGYVTFNILFDLATKAEKFVLAEMILQEMEKRKILISRHARVGLIYYHGMRGDGGAVRQAYRDFVDSGQIVDTVVLNCVIASLIRSGEPQAAEMVFGRMKRKLTEQTGRQVPNLNWREPRDLGKELDLAARTYRFDPRRRKEIQDRQLLAPDPRTYAILVDHYATTTGEIMKISTLVTEMHHLGMPMEGKIFVRIFKGFAFHGGIRYTAWTTARLDSVWNALLSALDQRLETLSLDRWLAVWIVRAFQKCFGPAETLAIWEELRKRWKGDFRELSVVQDMLKEILTNAVHHQGST